MLEHPGVCSAGVTCFPDMLDRNPQAVFFRPIFLSTDEPVQSFDHGVSQYIAKSNPPAIDGSVAAASRV